MLVQPIFKSNATKATIPSGCTGYWNTKDIGNTIVSGNFQTLIDLSGNGQNFVQATQASQPIVITINGRQMANFSGSQFMQAGSATLASFISAAESTVLARFQPLNITTNDPATYLNQCVFGDDGGFYGIYLKTPAANVYNMIMFNWDSTDTSVITTGSLNTWITFKGRHTSGNLKLTQDGTNAIDSPSGNTQALTHVIKLGVGFPTHYYIGYFEALAIWNRALSYSEISDWFRVAIY